MTDLKTNLAAQQTARSATDEKCWILSEQLATIKADFASFKESAESEKISLTKGADDAYQRLTAVSDELQALRRHITMMTATLFGKLA